MRLPPDRVGRDKIVLGVTESGEPLGFAIRGRNVLIAGDPRSGKSWVTGLFCEQLMLHDYCTCVIDPEGDYEQLEALPRSSHGRHRPAAITAGPRPDAEAPRHECGHQPFPRAIQGKVDYLKSLLPMLASLEEKHGPAAQDRIDEAHYFLYDSNVGSCWTSTWARTRLSLTALRSSPRCSQSHGSRVRNAHHGSPKSPSDADYVGNGTGDWSGTLAGLADGEAALLPGAQEALGKLQRCSLRPRLTAHVRHRSSISMYRYRVGMSSCSRQTASRLGRRAKHYKSSSRRWGSVSTEVLDGHVRRGDFSRWIAEVFHDHPLASDVRKSRAAISPRVRRERARRTDKGDSRTV